VNNHSALNQRFPSKHVPLSQLEVTNMLCGLYLVCETNPVQQIIIELQLKAKREDTVINYVNSERLIVGEQARWAVVCSQPKQASFLQFVALLACFASDEDENLQACGTRLQYPRKDSQWICGKYEINSSQG
jgi:hypothetical protein